MLKKKIIFLFLLIGSFNVFSQINIEDSLSYNNPQKVISEWVTNYNQALTNEKKSVVLIQTAYALQKIKDYRNSLIFLDKTEKKIITVDDPYFKALMYLRMASLYSMETHNFKANQLVNLALEECNRIQNNDNKYYSKAFAYYTISMIQHAEQNFDAACKAGKFSLNNFYKISESEQGRHERFLMFALVNISDAYMKLGDFKNAEELQLKAEALSKRRYLGPEITNYGNLIENSIKINDNGKAIFYGQKALEIIPSGKFLKEKNDIYKLLIYCYQQNKDLENEKNYRILKKENEDKILLDMATSLNKDIKIDLPKKDNLRASPIIVLICFIILLVIFYFRKSINFHSVKLSPSLKQNSTENKSLQVSDDVEKELLRKLENFEQSDRFINPKLSVAFLAGMLDTNIQYLSFVINKNKGKNFNSYINNLRIQYIVEKLKKDPQMRIYKISYLATLSGFISHSTFSKIFKQEMGILPSEFIKNLENHNSDLT